ncbi:hypothetical protein [Echinimonas agarilytica]|uniref:PEP-CTERM sorting domain-containing protein n=1 Tax=Echinimonas agarilytica TaxID=1215918 RepID=A0AA42B5T5_9GAMM|nr:hypothetical protein [Echinimonas agarilytica]MCM2678143.1 hypothetical protein [Echinimonas agarilytica]
MLTKRHVKAVIASISLGITASATATSLHPDLDISGYSRYDINQNLTSTPAAQIIDFGTTIAGTATTSSQDPHTSRALTQSVSFTQLGDGVSVNVHLEEAQTQIGEIHNFYDYGMSLTNLSGTVSHEVFFEFNYDFSTLATGNDAYITTEMFLFDNFYTNPPSVSNELTYAQNSSDSLYGDQLDHNLTGTFGQMQASSGVYQFSKLLAPGEIFDFNGWFEMQGQLFDPGSILSDAFASLSIIGFDDVRIGDQTGAGGPPTNPIPAPHTALLIIPFLWMLRRTQRQKS